MRSQLAVLTAAMVFIVSVAARPAAQDAPPGRGGAGPGAGGGGGNRGAAFPAQQRAPGDPARIARGNGLYGSTAAPATAPICAAAIREDRTCCARSSCSMIRPENRSVRSCRVAVRGPSAPCRRSRSRQTMCARLPNTFTAWPPRCEGKETHPPARCRHSRSSSATPPRANAISPRSAAPAIRQPVICAASLGASPIPPPCRTTGFQQAVASDAAPAAARHCRLRARSGLP